MMRSQKKSQQLNADLPSLLWNWYFLGMWSHILHWFGYTQWNGRITNLQWMLHIHSPSAFLTEGKKTPAFERSLWLLVLAFTFQYLTIFSRFLKYWHILFFSCSGLIFINFVAQNIGLELGNVMIQQPFSTITSSILEASRHCFGGWRDRCGRKSMKRDKWLRTLF